MSQAARSTRRACPPEGGRCMPACARTLAEAWFSVTVILRMPWMPGGLPACARGLGTQRVRPGADGNPNMSARGREAKHLHRSPYASCWSLLCGPGHPAAQKKNGVELHGGRDEASDWSQNVFSRPGPNGRAAIGIAPAFMSRRSGGITRVHLRVCRICACYFACTT